MFVKKLALVIFLLGIAFLGYTQNQTPQEFQPEQYNALQWRQLGPFRGGRSTAVTGVPGKPNLFYMGATGGGVWRTTDGGRTWENISDGYFGGSIGAIAVSESDNNVLYAGGGEETVRGNVSYGYGMYKSEDAGKSWKALGLSESRHISRIRIHPTNSELIYVAVMGDLFKSSKVRGVYRSKDGGKTFEKVLFVNEDVGAVDLCLDPTNPRILYASTWRFRRTPYSFSSGGAGSAIWKSTDGGDNWTEISKNEGLPKDTLGIIGLAVSPLKPERVWAIVEAKEGGLFRSDNGGNSWTKLNDSRDIRQRAWYYSRVYADTKDEDIVYVMNVNYFKSKDGGKTFMTKNALHGDHHDFWVAPEDSKRLIIGDDGGAQISYDGGETWSTYHNQPTAQFYRVTTDNDFPFRIYVAQQDNSALRIRHRSDGGNINEDDWEETAGGESAHIAVDPTNSDIVYGGSYGGYLTRMNHKTGEERAINVWPDNPMGHGAEGMKYRFQWNFPIFFSPHNKKKLYACSNHLHATTDEGQSWELLSPDLTTNDSTKLGASGGPITKDNTGVEYYCTIFAAAESPIKEGILWTGSDDGLVHVSTDGGKNWQNVTPPTLPKGTQINSLEASPFDAGACYIAATSYKSGDYQPYLFKTINYGKTWEKITKGIPIEHFTRVVRADLTKKGILYCGTETGMFISFDDGANWKEFQLNLPIVPITDLTTKENTLIAATQGRSLWIIDDLTPLYQLETSAKPNLKLYQPKPSYRMRGYGASATKLAGANHPEGVLFYYYLPEIPSEKDTVRLVIQNSKGETLRILSNKPKENEVKITPKKGSNLATWNMRIEGAKRFEGLVLWNGTPGGAKVVPGKYRASLSFQNKTSEQEFVVLKDPRIQRTQQEFEEQFSFLKTISDKVSQMNESIGKIRSIRKQINHLKSIWEEDEAYKPLIKQALSIDSSLTEIEKKLYQTQNRSGQDPLNFPIRLNDKLSGVYGLTNRSDDPPTRQARQVSEELIQKIDVELQKIDRIFKNDIQEFNKAVNNAKVDVLFPK